VLTLFGGVINYKTIVRVCSRKITSFMANHLCYECGGDGGRVEYALRNIVSVERVSELRCDFVRRYHCKILTTILWLCECLGREFWPGGGDLLCGIKHKSPKSFARPRSGLEVEIYCAESSTRALSRS
jgi:hypothetical protein